MPVAELHTSSTSPPATSSDAKSTSLCSSSSSDKTKIGVGVDLGVGVPPLAAVGGLLFLLLREKRANRHIQQQHFGQKEVKHEMGNGDAAGQGQLAEMPAANEVGEMEGMAGMRELSSGTVTR